MLLNRERLVFAGSLLMAAAAAWWTFVGGREPPSEPLPESPLYVTLKAPASFSMTRIIPESDLKRYLPEAQRDRFIFTEPPPVEKLWAPVKLNKPYPDVPEAPAFVPEWGPALPYTAKLPRAGEGVGQWKQP